MSQVNYKIAHYGLHFYEEPCISGTRGSGTVFFSGCNLRCVYCQNYQISQLRQGTVIGEEDFLRICEYLQSQGCNNINLVTPTHYVKCLQITLPKLKETVNVPVCYNTSGYENVDDLAKLSGLVDIYLTDLRYFSDELAVRYSSATGYFKRATASLAEMLRQQPQNVINGDGLLQKGVIVRVLALPSHKDDTKRILDYLAENYPSITISLMAQYFPTYKAKDFPEISRKLTKREYQSICDYAFALGFENGYMQDLSSAKEEYVPQFNSVGQCDNPLHIGKNRYNG